MEVLGEVKGALATKLAVADRSAKVPAYLNMITTTQ